MTTPVITLTPSADAAAEQAVDDAHDALERAIAAREETRRQIALAFGPFAIGDHVEKIERPGKVYVVTDASVSRIGRLRDPRLEPYFILRRLRKDGQPSEAPGDMRQIYPALNEWRKVEGGRP